MHLTAERPEAVAKNEGIEELEAAMLSVEQAECPVAHKFGPVDPRTGMRIYIREVVMQAGTLAIGHKHKVPCYNEMLFGKVAILNQQGKLEVVSAPFEYEGRTGERKAGYVLETLVWRNLWTVSHCDIAKLEDELLDKSETFASYERESQEIREALRQTDRDDYAAMLEQYGFTEETVRTQSENESDQIDMPSDWLMYATVRKSDIEGSGLFSNLPVLAGEVIVPARIGGMRTPAGRFVNHSRSPNCVFSKSNSGDVFLRAARDIEGSKGGEYGEELTVDYRQALSLSGIEPKDGKCQE